MFTISKATITDTGETFFMILKKVHGFWIVADDMKYTTFELAKNALERYEKEKNE